MTPTIFLLAAILGLFAGLLGGLAGIGGSMVMLPGLAFIFGFTSSTHDEQHAYQAAAMIVNVVVAIPATHRHARAGAIRRDLITTTIPSMVVAVIAGTLLSNTLKGVWLTTSLASFIILYCTVNLIGVARTPRELQPAQTTPPRSILILAGLLAGFVGGVLGLGGGIVMVPMLQLIAHVPLRQSIATSAASMIISAAIGASVKLASLPALHQSPTHAAILALAMAPGAVLGAHIGAGLAHSLPLRAIRITISVILFIAAIRLIHLDAWLAQHLPL